MKVLPELAPVVGYLAGADLHERFADDCLQIGQRGDLPGRAVDGVLDHLLADVHLFDPGGRQLQQRCQHQLCLLAFYAEGETDHAAWLPSARRSLANIDSCERRFSSVRLSLSW